MNGSIEQRVAAPKVDPRAPTIGFFALMVIFVVTGGAMVYWGRNYHGKFGQAVGIVVDAKTGTPVANAKVFLKGIFPANHPTAHGEITIERDCLSAADGRFVLSETVSGNFALTITHDGFSPYSATIAMGVAEHKDLGKLPLTSSP